MSTPYTLLRARRLPANRPFHPDDPSKLVAAHVPQSFSAAAPRFDCNTPAKMDQALQAIVRTKTFQLTASIDLQEYVPDSQGNYNPGTLTTQQVTQTLAPPDAGRGLGNSRDEAHCLASLMSDTAYDYGGGGLDGDSVGVNKAGPSGTAVSALLNMGLVRRSDPADARLPFIFSIVFDLTVQTTVYGQQLPASVTVVGALAANTSYYPYPPYWHVGSLTFAPFAGSLYLLQFLGNAQVNNQQNGNYTVALIQTVNITPLEYWSWGGVYDTTTGELA